MVFIDINCNKKKDMELIKIIYKKIISYLKSSDVIYPKPLEIKQTDKILILAPHADDESIGCGGLLLKYAKQCEIICVTNCKTGNPSVDPEEAIIERYNEFKEAMNFLGAKYHFNKDIDSDNLKNSYKLFEKLLNKYDLSTFNYIALPIWYDQHCDHKALNILFKKYLKKNNINLNCKILIYEVWSAIAVPNKFIDLTDILDKKKQLIGFHKSQINVIDYREKIQGLNIYRGMIVNKKAAEVYLEFNIKEFKEL